MTNTEQYTEFANSARTATEKSVEIWKLGAETFTEQASKISQVDFSKGIEQYFEFVQRSIDAGLEFASKWVEAVTSLTTVVGEQEKTVGDAVLEQTEKVADLVIEEAEKVTDLVIEEAEKVTDLVTEEAEQVEEVAREQVEKVEKIEQDAADHELAEERRLAKEAHEKAREPYQGMTKAELSELLAERDLPKSGNLDQLVERLVKADAG
jgi:hypothetical protein